MGSGCVLAVEKRLSSPLLDPSSVEKIAEIDKHVGAAMSGLVADAKTLVDHARVEAQNHTFTYDEPMGVEALTQAVCDLALSFGEGSDGDSSKRMSRPFGVALLLAGYDENMTLEEAENLALSTLKHVMEEKISTNNIEMARVVPKTGFRIASADEVGAVLERL